jgi:hypothetical protein
MVAPLLMQLKFPNTIPKQWYKGTGMTLSSSVMRCVFAAI